MENLNLDLVLVKESRPIVVVQSPCLVCFRSNIFLVQQTNDLNQTSYTNSLQIGKKGLIVLGITIHSNISLALSFLT